MKHCISIGANLVIIANAAEQQALAGYLRTMDRKGGRFAWQQISIRFYSLAGRRRKEPKEREPNFSAVEKLSEKLLVQNFSSKSPKF